jgi:hypothetical protein
MSKFARSVASALSFAHLTGFGSASSKGSRAEDDDEDKKKSRRAEDDRDDDDDDDKKEGRADGDDPDAEDGDDDKKKSRRASSDDHDDDEEDKPKSKKAKRAKADGDDPEDDPDAEDDDDEDEMRGSSAASKARGRERARIATILSSKHAAKNLPMALNLACNTTLTRKQVLAVLRDTPAAHTSAPANGHRAGRNPNLGTDRADSPNRSAAVASRWDRAMTKVRGGK